MTLSQFYRMPEEIQRRERRRAITAAIALMKDACPTWGWCLSGTGAAYARNAIKHLEAELAASWDATSIRRIQLLPEREEQLTMTAYILFVDGVVIEYADYQTAYYEALNVRPGYIPVLISVHKDIVDREQTRILERSKV
jgi:hypothetical protein